MARIRTRVWQASLRLQYEVSWVPELVEGPHYKHRTPKPGGLVHFAIVVVDTDSCPERLISSY